MKKAVVLVLAVSVVAIWLVSRGEAEGEPSAESEASAAGNSAVGEGSEAVVGAEPIETLPLAAEAKKPAPLVIEVVGGSECTPVADAELRCREVPHAYVGREWLEEPGGVRLRTDARGVARYRQGLGYLLVHAWKGEERGCAVFSRGDPRARVRLTPARSLRVRVAGPPGATVADMPVELLQEGQDEAMWTERSGEGGVATFRDCDQRLALVGAGEMYLDSAGRVCGSRERILARAGVVGAAVTAPVLRRGDGSWMDVILRVPETAGLAVTLVDAEGAPWCGEADVTVGYEEAASWRRSQETVFRMRGGSAQFPWLAPGMRYQVDVVSRPAGVGGGDCGLRGAPRGCGRRAAHRVGRRA